jgi:RNA polymerase sigma factor (sigma-70 family)
MDAAALERVYHAEATRIKAALAARLGDVGLAEDAVQDAFVEAIEHWRDGGIPANCGGWLATTARRKAIDRLRRARVGREKLALLAATLDTAWIMPGDEDTEDDELLGMIFACCHPALPREAQIALTLRAVCGLSTAQIAAAFLVAEPAMTQRLLRARKALGAAKADVRVPDPDQLASRLAEVLAVVYLVFNEGYLASAGRQPARRDLAAQAVTLARLLHRLMPREPEVAGLLALVLLHESRAATRFDGWGRLVRLADQDRTRWDRPLVAEATRLLDQAIAMRASGPYQVQAAIAALHAEAPDYEQTDWRQIRMLYDRLQELTPSPVVLLNRAVATRYVLGPRAALAEIEPLAAELDGYRLFHALRAGLLTGLGRDDEAREASERALALAGNPAERELLARRLSFLRPSGHISTTGRTSTVIHPRSTPGQVFAISTASSMVSVSSTEYPPSASLVSMNGPSVTPPARTVLAVAGGVSWCPPSTSLPEPPPPFSYQAPISAYHAWPSASDMLRAASVSSSRMTYFTLPPSAPLRGCHHGIPAPVPRTGRRRFRHDRRICFRDLSAPRVPCPPGLRALPAYAPSPPTRSPLAVSFDSMVKMAS